MPSFQPFERFRPHWIDEFRRNGKSFLVSQTYERGRSQFFEPEKTPILMSYYSSLNQAREHLRFVQNDKYVAILDLENEIHRSKLAEMLKKDSPYAVYASVIVSITALQRKMNKSYKEQIKSYVKQNVHWTYSVGRDIDAELEVIHGGLYVTIRRGNQQIRITFDELEKS